VAQVAQQLLTQEEEVVLVDWIGHQATIAKPLDKHSVLTHVHDLSGSVPGKNWVNRFEKRHQEVRVSKPGNLDPKRAQNFNRSNVARFFDLLKGIYDVYPDLPPQHIWNMDEKGVQFGGGCKHSKKYYHLQNLKRSKFYQIRSDNLELMTVIECISPSGLSIPPTFVLSSGRMPALTNLTAPIGAVATSPNGWTDNEIGADWFQHTFVPFATAHKLNNTPIVLLLDGHDSHESDNLRNIAFQHNVIILAFPSKCTHKLQPLDVAVFSQTQRQWTSHCDRRIFEDIKMDRYNIIEEYMLVRPASMTPKLMASAFSSTGIFPFNPNIFTDHDFAPAKSFSSFAFAPESFPCEVASSSPIPSNNGDMSNSEAESDSDELDTNASKTTAAEIDWDTDPDDPDYVPPLPPSTMLTQSPPPGLDMFPSPEVPTSLSAAMFAPPFPPAAFAPPFPPAVLTPPFPSAVLTPPFPLAAFALPSLAASPPPHAMLSHSPLATPPFLPRYTRSQKASSPAVPVPIALGPPPPKPGT
jgi:hypothetical protein